MDRGGGNDNTLGRQSIKPVLSELSHHCLLNDEPQQQQQQQQYGADSRSYPGGLAPPA